MHHDLLTSDMSTGVTAIDELHRDFAWAMQRAASAPDEAFAAEFAMFVKRAERTFGIEEHWMEEADCPLLRDHLEQHARVLGALHHLHGQVMAGNLALGRDVLTNILPQWFRFHVATMDMTLATMMSMAQDDVLIPRHSHAPAHLT